MPHPSPPTTPVSKLVVWLSRVDEFSVFGNELAVHGDGVKDVAFSVDDARGIYKVRETESGPAHSNDCSVRLSAEPRASQSRLF